MFFLRVTFWQGPEAPPGRLCQGRVGAVVADGACASESEA
jgi:hypothetical protein